MTDDKKPFRQRIADGLASAKKKLVQAAEAVAQFDLFGKYKADGKDIDLPIDITTETVWATYEQMATVFGVGPQAIVKHVQNVYDAGELDRQATSSKMELVRMEGGRTVRRTVDHFNLDMILAVGYRVSGPKANEFRKWASQILKNYLVDGYALNGKRLNNDPAALLRLAQEVRAIRTSEKNLYPQVRETFVLCSLDYDKDSPVARQFFAQSQDRFHFAASEQTAAQIVHARCDSSKPNLGMTTVGNRAPTFEDARIAKNYLAADELRAMEILGEQWLLYAEGMAQRGKTVSMTRLLNKLDELIAVNEYPTFPGYGGNVTRPIADAHVRRELAIYRGLPRPSAERGAP